MSTEHFCPVCHIGQMDKQYSAAPLDYSDNTYYPIFKCKACGHGKTQIIENTANDLYEGCSYDKHETYWHKIIIPFLSILEKNKLKYIKCTKDTINNLLEIGCGKGRFLEEAKQSGYQVYGLEPSSRSYTFASRRLGASVRNVRLSEIDQTSGFPKQFGHIALWHVLEHLDNPKEVLMLLKCKLAQNGNIMIAVPNYHSIQATYGKSHWYHLDPPRHIHHFTPNSLAIMADECNLVIANIYYNSFYQDFIGDMVTLINVLLPGNNVIFNGLRLNGAYIDKYGAIRATIMSVCGLAIGLILFLPCLLHTYICQLLKRSGTMVAILKAKKIDK